MGFLVFLYTLARMRSQVTSHFLQILKEPLLHFLILGSVLFAADHFYSATKSDQYDGVAKINNPANSQLIVVKQGVQQHLAANFKVANLREPTLSEAKGMLDDYIRNEIASREASVMGLDQDDLIIQRRLRQKLEFLLLDPKLLQAPTEAQLQAWLDSHPESFKVEPQLAFQQVYFSPDKHGKALDVDIRQALQRLKGTGSNVDLNQFGDATMLPSKLELTTLSDISYQFGDEFANDINQLPSGSWQGPVASSYGMHLILISSKTPGKTPKLDDIRSALSGVVIAAHRQTAVDQLYAEYLKKYTVKIEPDSLKRESQP